MEVSNWITLGIFTCAQITALIVTYVNIRIKIKELELKMEALQDKITTNQHSFHVHEAQNEKTFDKLEKKQDEVLNIVNEVKNILISKNFS